MKRPGEIRDLYQRIQTSFYRQRRHAQPIPGPSSDPNGFALHEGAYGPDNRTKRAGGGHHPTAFREDPEMNPKRRRNALYGVPAMVFVHFCASEAALPFAHSSRKQLV